MHFVLVFCVSVSENVNKEIRGKVFCRDDGCTMPSQGASSLLDHKIYANISHSSINFFFF